MANPPGHFRNRPARWICALLLCSAAAKAQTLPNLQNPLTSVSAATASNCQSGVTGCQQATLAAETNVTISYQTQVVLGPGFDAKAVDTSTSLTILPPPPGVTSVTPSSGSGSTQNFTVAASSSNWADAGVVQILFNWATWAPGSCYAIYYQSSNLMYLLNDDGSSWGTGYAPGSQASLSNSQCTLNVQNSSAPLSSGNNLSVTFSVTFKPSFFGTQQTFADVSDASGQNSGWLEEGTWTAYAAPYSQTPCTPASSCALTPSGQTGMSAQFTITSSDLNGAAYIPEELIFLGPNSTNSCILLVYDANNAAYLLNDASSSWTPIPAANSQCAISGTSGSNSGNNWIYNVSATFSPSYAGTKPMYLEVYDHALQTNGLQQVGTWTVGTPESITLATNPPGLAITADGTSYASPQAFSWAAGSQHTIAASSPQTTGTGAQYIFSNWSDSGAASHNITVFSSAATYTANFAPVDFTLTVTPTANPSIAMAGGNAATYTVSVGSLNGFSGTVTLTAPPLPVGFTASFGTNTIAGAGSTTMTIAAPAGSIGNIAVSATGTSGPLVHSAPGGTLAVQDFTAVLSPSYPSPVTVAPSTQATWTVVTSGLNGFSQPITLSYSVLSSNTNLPACTGQSNVGFLPSFTSTISFNPGQTGTLAIVAGNAQQYQCSFEVFASYGGTTHAMTGYLIQQGAGDFILTQPASQTANAGSAATFQAAYTPILGFSGTVSFNVTGLPSGVTWSALQLASPQYGDSIGVSVPSGTGSGTYPLTFTATSGGITHTVATQLIVQGGPDFILTASPTLQTIQQGQAATYTVALTPLAGFSGAVSLSMAAIPSGVSATLSTNTISANSPVTLTLTASSTATLGAYRIQVNGASGSDSHYAVAPLLVTLGPSPGTTIALGSVPVQVPTNNQPSVPPTTIVSPLPTGEMLSAAGCTPPSGVSVAVAPAQGGGFAQTLSISASSGVQVPTSGTLSCVTSAGRTVRMQLVFGYELQVILSSAPEGGGVFDVNVQTQGFSEVDSVILTKCNGLECDDGDDELDETAGDVSLDFSEYIAQGTCANLYAYVVGFTDASDAPGPAYASALLSVCNEYEPPPPPTIKITSHNPIVITPSTTTPGQYVATLTSVAFPTGGTYAWSTNNRNMVGFASPSSGPGAGYVTLGILSTNASATITLTYYGPNGGEASDSFTFALTNDTVAVAWVDGSKIMPDLSLLPGGILDPMWLTLNVPASCITDLPSWAVFGQQQGVGSATNGFTSAEITYANQFQLHNTGNSPPPQQMTDNIDFILSGNYRMYQRLQASYEVAGSSIIPQSVRYLVGPYVTEGATPEPCSGLELYSLPVQASPTDGKYGLTSDASLVYQINEARLGPEGQGVNQFLNGVAGQDFSLSTPWIWSVVQFDANGYTRAWQQGTNANNLQIFPTYQIYTNGFGLAPTIQGNLSTFIGLNATSQYTGQQ